MEETSCSTLDEYFILLGKAPDEASRLIESFQISYSEFFRNPLTFSVLERIVLPSLVQKRKQKDTGEVRIWSSACAAGQEPYSLAILMEDVQERRREKQNYRIFATDQNQPQVDEAQQGKYQVADMGNVTLKRASTWFDKHGNTYWVKQELKNNIDFSVFDLFDEKYSCPPASIFGDFDLVVCANLLFYYKNEERGKILEKVSRSLNKDGFLITGETEREILIRYGYKEVFAQSGVFIRK
jgi:chemotaxis methyl-accepting protein methylase